MGDANVFQSSHARSHSSLKVRLFCKYARLGASSRLRMLQYIPGLQQDGIDVKLNPLFPDAYVKDLYTKGAGAARGRAWRYYKNRIAALRQADDCNIDWIQGELLPYVPQWIERLLGASKRPYVVDYDDALFHRYDLSPIAPVRWLLHDKIDEVMRRAACVVAGNHYLADRAQRAGAKRVEIIPTVVDIERYASVIHSQRTRVTIGWIGSPVTERYLRPLYSLFKELNEKYSVKLLLVGASANVSDALTGIDVETMPWAEESEVSYIARMDIGIMPLNDSPWEQGKCGYKLIQYMACGLPVVASPVGVNSQIVHNGENGFLAGDIEAWRQALSNLIESMALRAIMGKASRKMVEDWYNIAIQKKHLTRILKEAASEKM